MIVILFKLFCMTSNKIQNFNLKSNQNYKLGLTVKAGAGCAPPRYRLKGFAHTYLCLA